MVIFRRIQGGEGSVSFPPNPPFPTRGFSGLFGRIIEIATRLFQIFKKETERLPNDYPYPRRVEQQHDTEGWGGSILRWVMWWRSD